MRFRGVLRGGKPKRLSCVGPPVRYDRFWDLAQRGQEEYRCPFSCYWRAIYARFLEREDFGVPPLGRPGPLL